jgi:hypothetical protein
MNQALTRQFQFNPYTVLPHFSSPFLLRKQCLPNYFCQFAWDLFQGLLHVGTFIRVTRSPCNQPYQSLYLKFSSHYTSYNKILSWPQSEKPCLPSATHCTVLSRLSFSTPSLAAFVWVSPQYPNLHVRSYIQKQFSTRTPSLLAKTKVPGRHAIKYNNPAAVLHPDLPNIWLEQPITERLQQQQRNCLTAS